MSFDETVWLPRMLSLRLGTPKLQLKKPLAELDTIRKYALLAAVSLLTIVLWVAIVVAGALFGWWKQPIASRGDSRAFMQAAIEVIEDEGQCNAALVLIENGTISGEYYSSSLDPVNRDTVFATASLSKWITAWAVLKLVEDGKLDLDKPIDDYLSRWHLPSTNFDNSRVTTRRLLSHTAGLTDGLGFADLDINEQVPSLEHDLQFIRRLPNLRGLSLAAVRFQDNNYHRAFRGLNLEWLDLIVKDDEVRKGIVDSLSNLRGGRILGNGSSAAGR